MKNKEIVTPEQSKKIKEYYKECELWLPDKPQWRYFIFKLQDRTFKRFHIKNKTELRKLLIKYLPLIIYYSAGAWLNVQNVRGRLKTTSKANKIFEDLVLDIDNDHSINEARKSALEIIKRIGEPDYILFTRRGMHLTYFKQGHKKKEILEKLTDIKDLDSKCTENEFNVFSLPFTLNKSGKINIFLTLDQLRYTPISLIEARREQIFMPNAPINTPEKLEKANEEVDKTNSRLESEGSKPTLGLRSKQEKQGKETGPGVTVLSFHNQIKNKLFIPILIYNKDLKGLKKELNYLVEHYNLGDLFVFQSETHLCFISLKVMDKRRLEKILNSSRSITKAQFKKFKKIWFNFSEWSPTTKINYESQKFLRVSKKHHEAFLKMGFNQSNQINELVGKEPIKVYQVGLS